MKTVLVPLIDSEHAASLLVAAAAVAKPFGSVIEGFCFKPIYAAPAFFEAAPAAMDENYERDYREQAALLRQEFFDRLKRSGISPLADEAARGDGGARWIDKVEAGYPYISHRAKLFDLTMVSGGAGSRDGYARGIFEAALFESGRPVLLVPGSEVGELDRNIVVAWNGSDESVRAMVFAMPLLQRAEKVTVLAVEGGMVPGPNAAEIAEYLGHHGIPAEATGVRPGDLSVGEAILEESKRVGANLIVKGAYTHSRLRQMVFGGPTRHIVENAEVPVLMAH